MTVGFGLMGLKGPELTQLRRFVDQEGDALEEAIEASGMAWSSWGSPPLKRVPAPYAQDHPHAEILKRKNLILTTQMTEAWRAEEGGLVRALRLHFESLQPLAHLMREHLSAG